MKDRKFTEIAPGFFVHPDYRPVLAGLGLTSIDAVFKFSKGSNLAKKNIAPHRTRIQITVPSPPAVLFLKRYDTPPILAQLKNWFQHRRRDATMSYDLQPAENLSAAGIKTPRTIAFGCQWHRLFEKRSFIITEKIPNAESIERKLPDYFNAAPTPDALKSRRDFVHQLALFAKKFHLTGYRHRDFYFAHIFYSNRDGFYIIDLQRAFKPLLLKERFRLKDIAQLCYSAPAASFSVTDRLRFYLCYADRPHLTPRDKTFIRKLNKRLKRMARHDTRHGRAIPFAR